MSIKPPKYSISKIVDLHDKLSSEVFMDLHSYTFTGDDFTAMVRQIHAAMPPVDFNSLYQSMTHLAGVELVNKHLDELSWRLAGNVTNLRNGIVVPPWTQQPFPEWVPLQITAVERVITEVRIRDESGKTRTNAKTGQLEKPGAFIRCFVLGGMAAGHKITKVWSIAYCHRLSADFGFSRFNREKYSRHASKVHSYPMLDVLELTRMRFLGLIAPTTCPKGVPNFDQIIVTSSCKKWNKDLMKRRHRQGFACPLELPISETPCYRCDRGYDSCPAGCHPKTFNRMTCPRCKNPDAPMDPALHSEFCVNCSVRNLAKVPGGK